MSAAPLLAPFASLTRICARAQCFAGQRDPLDPFIEFSNILPLYLHTFFVFRANIATISSHRIFLKNRFYDDATSSFNENPRKTKKQRLVLLIRIKRRNLAAKFSQDNAREKSRGEDTLRARGPTRHLRPEGASGGTPGGCRERSGAFSSPCLDQRHRTWQATGKFCREPSGIQAFSSTFWRRAEAPLC